MHAANPIIRVFLMFLKNATNLFSKEQPLYKSIYLRMPVSIIPSQMYSGI